MMLTLYHINLRYFQFCLLLLLCLKILQWFLFTLNKDQNSQHSLWSPASFYMPFPEHILLSGQGFFSRVLRRASFSKPESFVHTVSSAWSSLLSSLPNYVQQIPVYHLVFSSEVLKEFFSDPLLNFHIILNFYVKTCIAIILNLKLGIKHVFKQNITDLLSSLLYL